MAEPSTQMLPLPVIDSHIHLYPASELDTLAWLRPGHPLHGERSVAEYRAATELSPALAGASSLLGFVLVESDRRHDLARCLVDGDESGWAGPLAEVRWMGRVVGEQNGDGDDGAAAAAGRDGRPRCLALVPWAPLPRGPEVLAAWIDRVREAVGEDAWPLVRGFRYLLQDKPDGTMLEEPFVEAVRLLGRRGLVFEVAVDHHRRGRRQLDELVDLVSRAHSDVVEEEKVKFVIDHLCKPDFSIYNLNIDPCFIAWRNTIYKLSEVPQVYMKLSGALSEMPPSLRRQDPSRIFQSSFGWLGVVLATFGAGRLIFGSDWPICTVGPSGKNTGDGEESGGGGELEVYEDAWPLWKAVVDKMCWMASMGDEERAMIYGGSARKAYGF